MGFWYCAGYIALIGGVGFILGRLLPKSWINENRFPFSAWGFEDGGKIYERIGVRYWQKKLPDMSRILPGTMPEKKIGTNFRQELPVMIKETCVAEITHWFLCIAGLRCISLWWGPGGTAIACINILGNLPFILIQRYNRPRLTRLQERACRTRKRVQEEQEQDAAVLTK